MSLSLQTFLLRFRLVSLLIVSKFVLLELVTKVWECNSPVNIDVM